MALVLHQLFHLLGDLLDGDISVEAFTVQLLVEQGCEVHVDVLSVAVFAVFVACFANVGASSHEPEDDLSLPNRLAKLLSSFEIWNAPPPKVSTCEEA